MKQRYSRHSWPLVAMIETPFTRKFSDDTAIVACVRGGQEAEYRNLVEDFVAWCHRNNLLLNTSKTKEMVVDFRRARPLTQPVFIEGVEVEMVRTYRYLGLHLDERLDWTANTDILYRKGQSRLYFLRRLGSFNVCRKLLQMFYQTVVSSCLFYAVVCWGGSIKKRDEMRLDKLVRRAGSVVGVELDSVVKVAERRSLHKLLCIMDDDGHPLHTIIMDRRSKFSGRLLSQSCSTDRLRRSFICVTFYIFTLVQQVGRFASCGGKRDDGVGVLNLVYRSPVSTMDNFKFLGSIISQDLKWETNIDFKKSSPKGSAEDVLSAAAEEGGSATGPADQALHCSHRTSPVHIHHSLVWSDHSTGQEQITKDRKDSCSDHWCSPAHPPGPVLFKNQETGRKPHHRAVSHWTQHISTPPSHRDYGTLYTETTRHRKSFFPQAITFTCCTPVTTDAALPAEPNNFYASFETSAQAQSSNTVLLPTTKEEPPLILAAEEVRGVLMKVLTRKAAGPDGIPGRLLKACDSQLASTFTDIFNLSLAQSTVPVCFKTTTIIPIPKKSNITCMNDNRPIALTPIVMKCLHIYSCNLSRFRVSWLLCFPGLHISDGLRRVNLPQQLLCNFYRSTVESILTSCITVWYGSATSAERKALQRVVKTAQHITATALPPIQDIYNKRCLRKAVNIPSDPTHPSHPLFQLLPSGKRWRNIRARTTRSRCPVQ
ncbi:hypothetical protein NFI96_002240 [Prochilodus magdalenae]|nr:hypothetical protein NFI96_002240 [Prochilodus magdalenae]